MYTVPIYWGSTELASIIINLIFRLKSWPAKLLLTVSIQIILHGEPGKRGFLYLTAVIDWYSRCIVGWAVDDTLDTMMVIDALNRALKESKPQLINSDQGCQFTSGKYKDFLRQHGIRQSMDGKSRWADNVITHSSMQNITPAEAYYPVMLLSAARDAA